MHLYLQLIFQLNIHSHYPYFNFSNMCHSFGDESQRLVIDYQLTGGSKNPYLKFAKTVDNRVGFPLKDRPNLSYLIQLLASESTLFLSH